MVCLPLASQTSSFATLFLKVLQESFTEHHLPFCSRLEDTRALLHDQMTETPSGTQVCNSQERNILLSTALASSISKFHCQLLSTVLLTKFCFSPSSTCIDMIQFPVFPASLIPLRSSAFKNFRFKPRYQISSTINIEHFKRSNSVKQHFLLL